MNVNGVAQYFSCGARMTSNVYHQIYQAIGQSPPERGGLLGSAGDTICRFKYDPGEKICGDEYHPSVKHLNIILKQWREEGIMLCGLIHSHPKNMSRLSSEDIRFAKAILQKNPGMKEVLFPVVLSEIDSTAFQIIPYIIDRNGVSLVKLRIT